MRALPIAVLAVLVASLACTGGEAYAPAQNQGACLAYVEHINGLRCTKDTLTEAMCPVALDAEACDLTIYYGCMAAGARCDGDRADLSRQSICGTPTCQAPP